MISFRIDGLFGPSAIVSRSGITKRQAITTQTPIDPTPPPDNGGGDSFQTQADAAGYTCAVNLSGQMVCTAQGLVDLQFHNLQDLINQTNGAIHALYKTKFNQNVSFDSIAVDGQIDPDTATAMNALALSMIVPGLTPGYTPQSIAHDRAAIIDTLNTYVVSNYSKPTDTTGSDSTVCRNCTSTTTTDPGSGSTTTTTTDPSTGSTTTTTTDPVTGTTTTTPPAASGAGPTVYYVCADGTQETDPSLCAAQVQTTQAQTYSDPTAYAAPGSSSSPIVSVVVPSTAPVADTSRLFGLPRNWVLGGAVAAGIGISAAIVAVLAHRRR